MKYAQKLFARYILPKRQSPVRFRAVLDAGDANLVRSELVEEHSVVTDPQAKLIAWRAQLFNVTGATREIVVYGTQGSVGPCHGR